MWMLDLPKEPLQEDSCPQSFTALVNVAKRGHGIQNDCLSIHQGLSMARRDSVSNLLICVKVLKKLRSITKRSLFWDGFSSRQSFTLLVQFATL